MRGRGDLRLQLRLLLRPLGTIGLVGVVAAGTTFASAYLAWYRVDATVELLGTSQGRQAAALAGWQAQPWTWLVPAIGLATLGVAVAIAIDRPPRRAAALLLAGGIVVAVLTGAAALTSPPVAAFSGTRLEELAAFAGRMPVGAELSFAVRPAAGMWVALGGAALMIGAGLASREPSSSKG